ncbi:MAG: membrane dipeptidase [Deltaproteobacteria bacterium]|nr:membrane dipeptidase [Deltaproteobacteria bacterium]
MGDSLPEGLRDVSQYPNLVRVLLERGHDRAAVEKLLGGNLLRVWDAVLRHAQHRPAPRQSPARSGPRG